MFKNVPFDGNSSTYPEWRSKFVGQARLRKIADVLTGTNATPVPKAETDLEVGIHDEEIRVRSANSILVGLFESALSDKVSRGKIKATISGEYPDGIASEILKSLDKTNMKTRPSDKANLLKAFRGSKLKKNENPEEFFTDLNEMKADLEMIFGYKVLEEEMLEVIIQSLNELYKDTKKTLLIRQNKKNSDLTVELAQDAILMDYDLLVEFKLVSIKKPSKGKKDDSDEEGETALATFPTKPKGQCRLCGGRGHKADNCWENKKNESSRPPNWMSRKNASGGGGKGKFTTPNKDKKNIKCFFCDKMGHYKSDCRDFKAQQAAGGEKITLTKEDKDCSELVILAAEMSYYECLEEQEELSDEADEVSGDEDEDSLFGNESDNSMPSLVLRSDLPADDYSSSEGSSDEESFHPHVSNLNEFGIDKLEELYKESSSSEASDKGYELSDDFFDQFEEGEAQQGLNEVELELPVDFFCKSNMMDYDTSDNIWESLEEIGHQVAELGEFAASKMDSEEKDAKQGFDDIKKDLSVEFICKSTMMDYDTSDNICESLEAIGHQVIEIDEIVSSKLGSEDLGNMKVKIEPKKMDEPKVVELLFETTIETKTDTIFIMSDGKGNFFKMDRSSTLADSGASSHIRNNLEGMGDLTVYKTPITVGNSGTVYSTHKGTFHGIIHQLDGNTLRTSIKDTLVVPQCPVNLFSITAAIKKKGIKFRNVGDLLQLEMPSGDKITFDRKYVAGQGYLLGVDILADNMDEVVALSKAEGISLEKLHAIFGHPNETTTRATANALGLAIKGKGKMEICENCAKGKAKKKNVNKCNLKKYKNKGERIYIDLSSVRARSFGGAKFWVLIEDEATSHCWSLFLKNKSDLKHEVLPWVKLLKKKTGVDIKIIRCDNAGENKSLQEAINADEDLKIDFEFTAPYTPEQNGVVERKLATLWGKVRSMLNGARLPKALREGLWGHAAETATKLENLLVNKEHEKSPAEQFYGEQPKFTEYLRTFGEVGIVSDEATKKTRAKLQDRGLEALFVGYPEDHAGDVYKLLSLTTKKIIKSRNVIWLNKNYSDYKKLVKVEDTTVAAEDDSEDDETIVVSNVINNEDAATGNDGDDDPPIMNNNNDDDDDEGPPPPVNRYGTRSKGQAAHVTPVPPQLMNKKLDRELQKLSTSYNPVMEGATTQERNEHITMAMESMLQEGPTTTDEDKWLNDVSEHLMAMLDDGGDDPKNYRETTTLPDSEEWWKGMVTEFENMEKRHVWELLKRSDVPADKRLVGNKWVYKKKDDGRYRARTVALGYSQIPGVDYTENFAPVVNDETFRIALVLQVLNNLDSAQFDVETAFLYGDLDEEIYMAMPAGYDKYLKENGKGDYDPKEWCVVLRKSIYGLVQAARQWWKKFKEALEKLGFKPSAADPCLFIRRDKDGLTFLIIYVDDGSIFGKRAIIAQVLADLGKDFTIKNLGPVQDYVGCHLVLNPKKDTMWILQPKLILELKKKFGAMVEGGREAVLPAAPKFVAMRPTEGEPTIDDQLEYRSGVGMLLYLVKHSRPDIANAVRELTKVLGTATIGHHKAMLRTIKYVLETENWGLRLKPETKGGMFALRGLCDSEHCGDRETRISVYGYILEFCGAPIAWKSKGGKSVTLSSTESEYVAISELAKEILFVKQVLESIGIKVQLPIVVGVDNVGAIYLANNHTTSQRTKHIDIRHHFVRQYIEDGIIKIEFVRGEDNDADIFTKNTTGHIFVKHRDKHMGPVIEELD